MRIGEETITIASTAAGESNTVIETRNADNYIPQDVSVRRVVLVHVSDDSGAANWVTIEDYDDVDGAVDERAQLNAASNGDETLNAGVVLEVPRKDSDDNEHQLRYSCKGDFKAVIKIIDVA